MLFREFTVDESSAIYCISVLGNHVTIAFQSNTEKQYIFEASDRFIAHIRAILTNFNPDEISIGSVIAKARKSEDLIIINNYWVSNNNRNTDFLESDNNHSLFYVWKYNYILQSWLQCIIITV